MKKIKYLILMVAALNVASCDVLETIPSDRLASELYWRTNQDAEYAANAICHMLDNFVETINKDCLSDIGHHNFYAGDFSMIEKGAGDSQGGTFLDHWNKYYKGIRLANDYFANVDKIQSEDQKVLDSTTGEVRVLRAYFYYRLASLYGDVPLILTPLTIEQGRNVTRTPVEQIWDFIEDEFTDAAGVLPEKQAQKGRVTKGTALALKARAMLYAGRYTQAAEAAKAVIDSKVYDLYPSYARLFSYEAENSCEVVFNREYIKDQYSNEVLNKYGARSMGGNGSDLSPTRTLVDAYEMTNGKKITDEGSGYDPYQPYKDRDPRLSYTIFVPGDILPNGQVYDSRPFSGTADAYGSSFQASTTGWTPKKYMNPEDANTPSNCGINLILLRYAEVLLTYAEAKIELDQIDNSVYEAINQIRQRPDVNMPPIPTDLNRDELREAVRHERMIELALEGVRYFDIKRWRIGELVCNTPLLGMSYVNQEGELVFITDKVNPKGFDAKKNYLWAIPYNEILLNPKLTQNPGW